MENNLIAGLISGVVVTVLVFVFRKFWNSVIVPWFEEQVYKDVKIEGKWFGLYTTSEDLRQEVIVLKRHGHTISGTATCTKGPDEGSEYSLGGSFRNLILPLIYESTDSSKTDRGTITLRSIKNGERLQGKIAFYHTGGDKIQTTNLVWFRDKDDLESTIARIKDNEKAITQLKAERKRIAKEESEIIEDDKLTEEDNDKKKDSKDSAHQSENDK